MNTLICPHCHKPIEDLVEVPVRDRTVARNPVLPFSPVFTDQHHSEIVTKDQIFAFCKESNITFVKAFHSISADGKVRRLKLWRVYYSELALAILVEHFYRLVNIIPNIDDRPGSQGNSISIYYKA